MQNRRMLHRWILVVSVCICSCVIGIVIAKSVGGNKADEPGLSFECVRQVQLYSVEQSGISDSFTEQLGEECAVSFISSLYDNYSDSYAEVVCCDFDGKMKTITIPYDSSGYTIGAGCSAEGKEYAVLYFERVNDTDSAYILRQYDTEGNCVRETLLEQSAGLNYRSTFTDIYVDRTEYIHILEYQHDVGMKRYIVFNEDGERIYEEIFEAYILEGLKIIDGMPVYDLITGEDEQFVYHEIYCFNVEEKGKKFSLQFRVAKGDNKRVSTKYHDQIVYADNEGLFLCDFNSENVSNIFRWKEYGIKCREVKEITTDSEGNIAVLAYDKRGLSLYCFREKKQDVCEIELALPVGSDLYDYAVSEFNKLSDDFRIVIKDDYDRTALLTELIAGNGPVLIDSMLVPFEGGKDLWVPLNEIYAREGLWEELNEGAVRIGIIDGLIYGITPCFYIDTLITCTEGEWNYDSLFRTITGSTNTSLLVDNKFGENKSYVAAFFFDGGTEDSFFIDSDIGKTCFDTGEFRSLMNVIGRFGPDDREIPPVEGVREGEVLCNRIYIRKPEELAYYRKIYGDTARIVGYPRRNGSHSILHSPSMLVIRGNASEHEREGALAFVEYLLSYDFQKGMCDSYDFSMSVRRDVLEEQIEGISEDTMVYPFGFPQAQLSFAPDNTSITTDLQNLLNNSIPYDYEEKTYKEEILYQEFEDYFSGAISEDMLIQHLESRVQIYLDERK